MRRDDAGTTARYRLGSTETDADRRSDNNELLAIDTVGNLSQPTSRLPPRPARLIMMASLRLSRSASGFNEDATTPEQLRALSRVSIRLSYQKGEANEDIRRQMDERVISPASPDFLALFGGNWTLHGSFTVHFRLRRPRRDLAIAIGDDLFRLINESD